MIHWEKKIIHRLGLGYMRGFIKLYPFGWKPCTDYLSNYALSWQTPSLGYLGPLRDSQNLTLYTPLAYKPRSSCKSTSYTVLDSCRKLPHPPPLQWCWQIPSFQLTLCLLQFFFIYTYTSFIRHRVAIMWMWIHYYFKVLKHLIEQDSTRETYNLVFLTNLNCKLWLSLIIVLSHPHTPKIGVS